MPFQQTFLPILLAALVLAGCNGTPDPVRYATPAEAPVGRISIPHRTVAIRDVSLPAYATDEGISIADGTGAIREFPDSIWADDPTRAVTLRLTNAIADITGRTVASDPWPFQEPADVVVEVRIEEFVAEEAGRFVAKGRFYVAHSEPGRNDRSGAFTVVVPFDPANGFPAISDARSRTITALAREITQRGLR